MRFFRTSKLAHIWMLAFCLCLATGASFAQSIDIGTPSPVRSHQISGSITARDVGDSRLTDHFYAFTGTPGDLLITVKSDNLNGDVDVFTVSGLRPLLKFSLYAGSVSPVTKAVYLRKREDLILRVQARTPSDDEGTYQIRFGGSFEPIAGEAVATETETPSSETASSASPPPRPGTRRVSSVGARLPEPARTPEEIAAAPTPEPTPSATPTETPAATETPAGAAEATPSAPTPRRGRGRAPRGRRPAAPPPAAREETAPSPTTPAEQPKQEPEIQSGPRLIIEMLDGTRVERYMSTVRRVTVENNQVVIVPKVGRIDRIRLSEIVRMLIEP